MTVTLITGGSQGIGYETARRLVAAGHIVWIGSRDQRLDSQAATRLGASFVPLDITDDTSVSAAVATVQREAQQLDLLVNNAGILGEVGPIDELTIEQLKTVYETNVFGWFARLKPFCPFCASQPRGP